MNLGKRLATLLLASILFVWVSGYFRWDGTYVPGYYRSEPNALRYDNYSWRPSQPLYNLSYYDYSRPSSWRTPAWSTSSDYWTGLNYYSTQNSYYGWFGW